MDDPWRPGSHRSFGRTDLGGQVVSFAGPDIGSDDSTTSTTGSMMVGRCVSFPSPVPWMVCGFLCLYIYICIEYMCITTYTIYIYIIHIYNILYILYIYIIYCIYYLSKYIYIYLYLYILFKNQGRPSFYSSASTELGSSGFRRPSARKQPEAVSFSQIQSETAF